MRHWLVPCALDRGAIEVTSYNYNCILCWPHVLRPGFKPVLYCKNGIAFYNILSCIVIIVLYCKCLTMWNCGGKSIGWASLVCMGPPLATLLIFCALFSLTVALHKCSKLQLQLYCVVLIARQACSQGLPSAVHQQECAADQRCTEPSILLPGWSSVFHRRWGFRNNRWTRLYGEPYRPRSLSAFMLFVLRGQKRSLWLASLADLCWHWTLHWKSLIMRLLLNLQTSSQNPPAWAHGFRPNTLYCIVLYSTISKALLAA